MTSLAILRGLRISGSEYSGCGEARDERDVSRARHFYGACNSSSSFLFVPFGKLAAFILSLSLSLSLSSSRPRYPINFNHGVWPRLTQILTRNTVDALLEKR